MTFSEKRILILNKSSAVTEIAA